MKRAILILLACAVGVWGSFTNYDIPYHKGFQRYVDWIPNSGKVWFTYTYSGPASNISAKVVLASTGAEVVGWTQVRSSAPAGTYTDTLSSVPCATVANGPYNIYLKSETVGDTVRGTNQWAVCIMVANTGQSYSTAFNTSTPPANYTTVNGFSCQATGIGGAFTQWGPVINDWQQLGQRDSFTSYIPALVNAVEEQTGYVVGICGYGQGGTGLVGGNTAYWGFLSADTIVSPLGKSIARMRPYKPEYIVWDQGETDVYNAIGYSSYRPRQDSLFKWWRDSLGYNVKVLTVAVHPSWWSTSSLIDSINMAKILCDDGVNNFFACWIGDLPLLASGNSASHPTKRTQDSMGLRIGSVIAKIVNGTTANGYRGLRVKSAYAISRGVFRISLDMGTATSINMPQTVKFFNVSNSVISGLTVQNIAVDSVLTVTISDKAMLNNMYFTYGRNGYDIDSNAWIHGDNGLPMEPIYIQDTVTISGITDAVHDRYFLKGDPNSDTAWATTSGGTKGAGKPDTTSYVFLDSLGNNDFSLTSKLNCASLYVKSVYTRPINDNYKGMYIKDYWYDTHASNLVIYGHVKIGGDAHVAASGTVIIGNAGSSCLEFANNSNYHCQVANMLFDTMIIQKNKTLVVSGSGSSHGCKGVLKMDSASLRLNNSFVLVSAFDTMLLASGSHFGGNGAFYLRINDASGTHTKSIPRISIDRGTLYSMPLYIQKTGNVANVEVNLNGLYLPYSNVYWQYWCSTGLFTVKNFDTISASALSVGSITVGANDNAVWRLGHQVYNMYELHGESFNNARTKLCYDSAEIHCRGYTANVVSLGSNLVTDTSTTASLYLDGASAVNPLLITTAGKYLPNVIYNKPTTTFKNVGNLWTNNLTVLAGRTKQNGSTDSIKCNNILSLENAQIDTFNAPVVCRKLSIKSGTVPAWLSGSKITADSIVNGATFFASIAQGDSVVHFKLPSWFTASGNSATLGGNAMTGFTRVSADSAYAIAHGGIGQQIILTSSVGTATINGAWGVTAAGGGKRQRQGCTTSGNLIISTDN